MDHHAWIIAKFNEWRGDSSGRSVSEAAYARWLGVPQRVVSDWIHKGSMPKSAKYVNALVGRYGGEVYDVLGITPASLYETALDAMTVDIIDVIKGMTPDEQRAALAYLRSLVEERSEYQAKEENDDQTKMD